MRDPVDRIAEIKAADPKRRALVATFEQWWLAHGDIILKAKDLAFSRDISTPASAVMPFAR